MSYILDALKKSDQDRQRRKPPSLETIYADEIGKPKKKAHWPYLIALALVLNAGLLLWWLRPWNSGSSVESSRRQLPKEQQVQVAKETGRNPSAVPAVPKEKPVVSAPQKQENREQTAKESREQPVPQTAAKSVAQTAATPAPGQQAAATSAPVQQSAATPVQQTAATPEAKSEKQAGGGTEPPPAVVQNPVTVQPAPPPTVVAKETPPNAEPKPQPEPPPKPGRGQAAPEVAPPAKTPPAPAAVAARPQEPVRAPGPAAPENLNKKALAKAAADAKMNKQVAPLEQANQGLGGKELVADLKSLTESEKPAGKKPGSVPAARLQDLPSPVRDSLPRMAVSMLIYSAKPGDRYININGAKMHEGQEVAAGLKVEEITPDGAVFSYQGMRFYKPVIGD
jgi:general secretion pathway protein B